MSILFHVFWRYCPLPILQNKKARCHLDSGHNSCKFVEFTKYPPPRARDKGSQKLYAVRDDDGRFGQTHSRPEHGWCSDLTGEPGWRFVRSLWFKNRQVGFIRQVFSSKRTVRARMEARCDADKTFLHIRDKSGETSTLLFYGQDPTLMLVLVMILKCIYRSLSHALLVGRTIIRYLWPF